MGRNLGPGVYDKFTPTCKKVLDNPLFVWYAWGRSLKLIKIWGFLSQMAPEKPKRAGIAWHQLSKMRSNGPKMRFKARLPRGVPLSPSNGSNGARNANLSDLRKATQNKEEHEEHEENTVEKWDKK